METLVDQQRIVAIKEIKEIEKQYRREIAQLNQTIETLDEEVKMERQLKYEVERGSVQYEELVASLVMNLGLEYMNMKKENSVGGASAGGSQQPR